MTTRHLITNAQVLDGLGNPAFPGSVLFQNGRIEKVAPAGSPLPELAEDGLNVIDAHGNWLMPGLIDSHCHSTFDEVSSNDELFFHRSRPGLAAVIAAENLKKILRAGVTSICDPDSIHELGYDLKEAINARVFPGPRIRTGGYALLTSVGGTAGRLIPDQGVMGYGKVVRGKDEIVAEVRRQVKMGADWIKVHVSGLIPNHRQRGELQVWSREELELVCQVAHDLGTPVMGHCRGSGSTRDAARAGFDLILHGTLMEPDAVEAVVEHKVPIAPTFTFQANLIDFGHRVGAAPFIQDLFRREIADSAEALRTAYDQGVPILCGSESGFSVTPYGHWHYREMEVLVKEMGFTPLEAIRSATSENARAMLHYGELGCIQEGAMADLLLLSEDPSQDVTVLGNSECLKMILKDGEIQDLGPAPERGPINGWRVVNYGQILTREVAQGSH
jgi:imidazolonepropionase-like amidohydrolase